MLHTHKSVLTRVGYAWLAKGSIPDIISKYYDLH